MLRTNYSEVSELTLTVPPDTGCLRSASTCRQMCQNSQTACTACFLVGVFLFTLQSTGTSGVCALCWEECQCLTFVLFAYGWLTWVSSHTHTHPYGLTSRLLGLRTPLRINCLNAQFVQESLLSHLQILWWENPFCHPDRPKHPYAHSTKKQRCPATYLPSANSFPSFCIFPVPCVFWEPVWIHRSFSIRAQVSQLAWKVKSYVCVWQ